MKDEIDKSLGKLRGTFASYKQADNNPPICDVLEVAKHFSKNVGNIPETVGFKKACEIHLLAKAFLVLDSARKNKND